jgi:hypothetical protein
MLTRLLRPACAVIAAFVLLVVAARLLGSAQPHPAALDGLHLTECVLPCWLGITPGITNMTDAAHRLRSAQLGGMLFESSDGRSVTTAYEVSGALVRVDLVADEAGTVAQITIFTQPLKGVRLGDAVAYLGTPTCSGGKRSIALYSGSTADAVAVGSVSGTAGLQGELSYIDFYAHSYELHPCTPRSDTP